VYSAGQPRSAQKALGTLSSQLKQSSSFPPSERQRAPHHAARADKEQAPFSGYGSCTLGWWGQGAQRSCCGTLQKGGWQERRPGTACCQKSRRSALVAMTGVQDMVTTAQAVQKSYRVEYGKNTEPPWQARHPWAF